MVKRQSKKRKKKREVTLIVVLYDCTRSSVEDDLCIFNALAYLATTIMLPRLPNVFFKLSYKSNH